MKVKCREKIHSHNDAVKNESKHSSNSIFNVTLLSINDKLPNSRVTQRSKMLCIFPPPPRELWERKNPKKFFVVIVVVPRCGESGEGKVFHYTNLICNLTKLFLLRSWDIFQQFTLRFDVRDLYGWLLSDDVETLSSKSCFAPLDRICGSVSS